VSTEPTQEAAFFSAIRSWGIVRSEQRVFGGVLGGVGARIGMAPSATRVIFVLLAIITGGLSLLAYAAAWALLPDAEGSIIIQDFGRGRPNVGALVAIAVMAFFGFITLGHFGMGSDWRWWDNYGMGSIGPRIGVMFALLIPLAVVGGIVALIVWSVKRGDSPDRAAQGYARLPDGTIPNAPVRAASVADDGVVAADAAVTDDAVVAEPAAEETVVADPAPASATALEPTAYVPPVYAAPVYSASTYAAPKPVYAPKPRVPGPGKFGYLAALAMIPLAAAATLYLHTTDQLAVFPVIAAGVIWVAGLGLILIINALRGRKAGFLGFVSFVALLPLGLTIAYADEIRDTYETGSHRWWTWDDNINWEIGNQDGEPSYVAEPIYTPEPAFDPRDTFSDYEAVAIQGNCFPDSEAYAPAFNGTVSLSSVPANQAITVTSSDTLLSIPQGTSLNIVSTGSMEMPTSVSVIWNGRDVRCDLNDGTGSVSLTSADEPVLTVKLDDSTYQNGFMNLWIEEN